jgi:hypothetical protein
MFFKCPVVIVPTKYFSTPTILFKELGISTVIWANHNLRASVSAMQNVCRQIMSEQSLVNIETKVSKSHSSYFCTIQFCVRHYIILHYNEPPHACYRMGWCYIHVLIHVLFCHFPWFVTICWLITLMVIQFLVHFKRLISTDVNTHCVITFVIRLTTMIDPLSLASFVMNYEIF